LLGLYKGIVNAKRFMTHGQYNEIRRKLNRPVVGIIEFNKWIFAKYCQSVGIPTPHTYGVFHNDIGFAEDQRSLRTRDELWDFLSSINGPFVIKPIAGDRGENVRVFDRINKVARTLTGANRLETNFDQLYRELVSKEEPWLLQKKVEQHPTLAALHASSVNTARLMTVRNDDGDVVILGAALRIGRGTSEADNTSAGGIATHIDLATGTCGPATSRLSVRPISKHPDTRYPIDGLTLPYWPLVKETALKAHRLLPFARSLGWDIAFGVEGPLILEVNGSWYHNRMQIMGLSLWETEFGKTQAAQSIRRR
jgi:hypothetical protein